MTHFFLRESFQSRYFHNEIYPSVQLFFFLFIDLSPHLFIKEESSEDEDEDPKITAAKSKLKQLINEDSDADSDFEKDLKQV